MAHKVIDGRVIVDWTTGDPEGDRLALLADYRDFITQIKNELSYNFYTPDDIVDNIRALFEQWNVSTVNQIDDVPRIWIKRP
jgi:hypothetical protein